MKEEKKKNPEKQMRIRQATCHLRSISPYSQSRPIQSVKRDNEDHSEFEERTWREHMHTNDEGEVFIPPMAFKNCLSECAKYLAMSVKGKGKATYTKHFEAGVMCTEPIMLGIKTDSVVGERLYLPSDGKRGGNKRVWKRYPYIPKWEGVVKLIVLDEIITEEIFEKHLRNAGTFIGIGRFRPRNNGFYGRFEIMKIEWQDL